MTELLNRIDSYLLGQSTLQYLEEWLLSNLQNILDSADQKTIDLANKIDADLVELAEGLMEESTIREYLQSYLMDSQTIPINYNLTSSTDELAYITASTAVTTKKLEFALR